MLKTQKLFTCVYTLAEFSWAKIAPPKRGPQRGTLRQHPFQFAGVCWGGLIVLAHAEDRESRDEKPGLPLNFHDGTLRGLGGL